MRIRLDAYASQLAILVSGNTFIAHGPKSTAQSIGSAVSVSVKCNAVNTTVILSYNVFSNHVGQQGSGVQVGALIVAATVLR